jgi:hypothetical protein
MRPNFIWGQIGPAYLVLQTMLKSYDTEFLQNFLCYDNLYTRQ